MRPTLVLLAVAVSYYANGVASHMLPETFPRCKQTDPQLNECLKKATLVVLPLLKEGIPTVNVPSLDPLKVDIINIGQGQGPISINMKFTNGIVRGLTDSKVDKLDADLKGYTLTFEGGIQNVTLESDYDMSGRILLLPVTGKGRCKLTITNLRAVLGPKGKGVIKKGKNYFDVTEFPLVLNGLDKMEVHFDNLFNGDKTLGNSMNTLLNENWKDLWTELRPAFEETFGAIFHQYSRGVFTKVAFNDIFLE